MRRDASRIIRFWAFCLPALVLFNAGCSIQMPGGHMPSQPSQATVHARATMQGEHSLRDLAQARGLYIGAAVNMDALQQDEHYRQTLSREFNMVTPENVMKFDAVHPQPSTYTFASGDALVAFAQQHGMEVRGHTLVWHRALPEWITSTTYTRAQLLQILHDHITTVVKHFRGQVRSWDVVNEALQDDGSYNPSVWYNTIGPEYIDMAFRWAHEADPQALLYYNDFGAEGAGVKSDAVYSLVKGMLQRGVPINGVGLQMHTDIVDLVPPADVQANMRRLVALGVKVEITEMDVKLQGDSRPLADKLQIEGSYYHDMLQACLSVKGCDAFVMWGFTDRYTWINHLTGNVDQPLIFDAAYRPKPSYHGLIDALI